MLFPSSLECFASKTTRFCSEFMNVVRTSWINQLLNCYIISAWSRRLMRWSVLRCLLHIKLKKFERFFPTMDSFHGFCLSIFSETWWNWIWVRQDIGNSKLWSDGLRKKTRTQTISSGRKVQKRRSQWMKMTSFKPSQNKTVRRHHIFHVFSSMTLSYLLSSDCWWVDTFFLSSGNPLCYFRIG